MKLKFKKTWLFSIFAIFVLEIITTTTVIVMISNTKIDDQKAIDSIESKKIISNISKSKSDKSNSIIFKNNLELINDKTKKIESLLLPKTTKEQFILSSKYYSGNINTNFINNGENKLGNDIANTIGINGDNLNNAIVQMSKGDSLVLVFNQNDNFDEKYMQNYISNLYFNDTSVSIQNNGVNSNDVISGANAQKIMIPGPWHAQGTGAFIKFDNTELSSWYYGSQTENLSSKIENETFGDYLASIASSYTNYPNQWEQIINYYGYWYKNGKYVRNPYIENPIFTSPNNSIRPLGIIPQNLWLIKQIAKNAFAFTYNGSHNTIPSISLASIGLIKNGYFYNMTPSLSLGNKYEWNKTLKNNNVIGQKINSKGEVINNEIYSLNDFKHENNV